MFVTAASIRTWSRVAGCCLSAIPSWLCASRGFIPQTRRLQPGVCCVITPANCTGPLERPERESCELRPLVRLRAEVDLRDDAGILHPAGDVEGLPEVPDRPDPAVERAEVVEQVARPRGAEAAEEVARAVERGIPGRLRVDRCGGLDPGADARMQAQVLGELHRLARPLTARLVRARRARVVVGGAARERDRRLRALRHAAGVAARVGLRRAR